MTALVLLDLPEADYHARPELSSTQARELLEAPAQYLHNLTHPREDTDAFDEGRAAHALVLGQPASWEVVCDKDGQPVPDRRGNRWKHAAARIRGEGRTPLLAEQADRITALAAALERNPEAGPLLAAVRDRGETEVTVVWRDDPTGVECRCRFDALLDGTALDYKTATSASPAAFVRSVVRYGYHVQQGHYLDGGDAAGLDLERFLFVVQDRDHPPYLASVIELDRPAAQLGRRLAREARERLRDCRASGRWPGHVTDPAGYALVSLPRYVFPED